MFGQFTDAARRIMTLAKEAAQEFNCPQIATEYMLLGFIREETGITILENLDLDARLVRLRIEQLIRPYPDPVTADIFPPTPRAAKAIEYANEEARDMGNEDVEPIHLLLGLLRERDGIAAQVLTNLNLTLEDVREYARQS